jgi:PST family polysaccharide transporter
MRSSRTILQQTIGLSFLDYIKYGVRFGTNIFLARLLAPEAFGTVALATAILSFLSMFGEWGVNIAVMQEKDEKKEFASTIFFVRLGFTLFLLFFLFVSLPVLRIFYGSKVVTVLFILAIPQIAVMLSTVFKAQIQKEFMLVRMGAIGLLGVIIGSTVGISMAYKNFGIWSLVAFYGVDSIVDALGSIIFSPFRPIFYFSKQKAKQFLLFAKDMFFSGSLERIMQGRGDDLVLGTLGGAVPLGFYSVGWRIARLFNTVFLPAINKAILPTFSDIKDDKNALGKTYTFLLRNFFRLAIPIYSFLIVFAHSGIRIILGEKWIPAVPLVRLLSIYGILVSLYNMHRHILYSIGKIKDVLRFQLFSFLVFFITIFPLTFLWSAKGTAISIILTYGIANFLLLKKIKEKIPARFLKHIFLPIAGTIISLVFVLTLKNIILINPWGKMLILGTIFVFSYFACLMVLDPRGFKRDIKRIRDLI